MTKPIASVKILLQTSSFCLENSCDSLTVLGLHEKLDIGTVWVNGFRVQRSGFSAAPGLKSGQFDRKRNIESFTFVLSFDVGRSMFDVHF